MQNPGLGIAKPPRHTKPEAEGRDQNTEAWFGKPLSCDLQPWAQCLESCSPGVGAEVTEGTEPVQTPQPSVPTSVVALVTHCLQLFDS